MEAMGSGNDSEHDLIYTEMTEKIVTEVSLIKTIIVEKPTIK